VSESSNEEFIMQTYFYQLADALCGQTAGSETLLLYLQGEDSDFVRFNKGTIRQGGGVKQIDLSLDLIDGQKCASMSMSLQGDLAADIAAATFQLSTLRKQLPSLPDDPYILFNTDVQNSEQIAESTLPDTSDIIDTITETGKRFDMVGIYATGRIVRGFANSLGQRNFFSTAPYHLDWCFYAHDDKAVKNSLGGFEWNTNAFHAKVALAEEALAVVNQPAKTIDPGEYSVYLSPSAMCEILDMMSWNGFSARARELKNTCVLPMMQSGATMNQAVTLSQNTAGGIAPAFSPAGYSLPDRVTLVDAGALADPLVPPRTSAEFNRPVNSGGESPNSLEMAPGTLATEDILTELDEGIYCNTLWYLNFSDMPAGRITGMTRFATFWVEGGQIAAPMNVMRFDETLFRALGENLRTLTADREFLPSATTYDQRSTSSRHLPGAIVDNFRFTL
jgi:predicted Zn-dependent protease